MNVFIFILLFPFLSSLQYDEYKNPMDNIGMQDSLLSRFDLLFIVLDQVSQTLLISMWNHVYFPSYVCSLFGYCE